MFKETPEQLCGRKLNIEFTSELSPDTGVYMYNVPGLESTTGASEHSQSVRIEYSQKQDAKNSEIVGICFTVQMEEEYEAWLLIHGIEGIVIGENISKLSSELHMCSVRFICGKRGCIQLARAEVVNSRGETVAERDVYAHI